MITDSQKNKPFFFVRMVNGQAETKGDSHCRLGHKLDAHDRNTPDGVFVEWHWDGETLTVTNDRFGFYPVYYYQDGDSFAISPSIIRMMPFCRRRDLDGPALGVYYRKGSFIGNDTHFKFIKALGPNTQLKWSRGNLTQTGGEIFIPKPIKISRAEAKKEFERLFARSIEKRRPKTKSFILPLSGGRDSRRILFELLKQDMRPDYCVTFKDFPDWRGQDLPVAQMITKELGLKHVILEQKDTRFEAEYRKNLVTDLCASRSVKMLTLTDYCNAHAQTTYDGIGGLLLQSFLMRQDQINLFKAGNFDPLTRAFLMQWASGEEAYKLVLNRKTFEMFHYDKAFAHLREEVSQHSRAANPIVSYYFWNRTRRDIALIPYATLSEVPYVYSPYLDHDLCEFLLSLPAEIIESGTFHDETFCESYPAYAHIPFEDKSVPNPKADAHWSQFIRDFSVYYFKQKAYGSKFLNNRYLSLRILRCLFDGRYRVAARWIPFVRILNLLQLEELVNCRREF